jgi:hypothetical protein
MRHPSQTLKRAVEYWPYVFITISVIGLIYEAAK